MDPRRPSAAKSDVQIQLTQIRWLYSGRLLAGTSEGQPLVQMMADRRDTEQINKPICKHLFANRLQCLNLVARQSCNGDELFRPGSSGSR